MRLRIADRHLRTVGAEQDLHRYAHRRASGRGRLPRRVAVLAAPPGRAVRSPAVAHNGYFVSGLHRALLGESRVAMKFDVYGRFQLEVVREGGEWVVYELGLGKRVRSSGLIIPSSIAADEVATFLDDLLHELSG